mmetsp:Transcript_11825/g.22514  ORF Transcript_11825/g.22514 Transcript_11825/m.22514 type:complete len:218 (+) Transcript_11825:285-938(+)
MDTVLSYHDVLLRHDDLLLLREPNWLNDQVLAFYFEYLAQEIYEEKGMTFVNGSMSYFLAHGSAEDASQMVTSMDMRSDKVIFFAVNNNPFVETAAGGSHWSLLVYKTGQFIHCDSLCRTNSDAAQQLAAKIGPSLDSSFTIPDSFVHAESPQQMNGYDCGAYVMANAKVIADACAKLGKDYAEVNIQHAIKIVTPAMVTALRAECLQLIHDIARRT